MNMKPVVAVLASILLLGPALHGIGSPKDGRGTLTFVIVKSLDSYVTAGSFFRGKIIPVLRLDPGIKGGDTLAMDNLDPLSVAEELVGRYGSFKYILRIGELENITPEEIFLAYTSGALLVVSHNEDGAESLSRRLGIPLLTLEEFREKMRGSGIGQARVVVSFRGDPFAYLGPLYAAATNASLKVVDSPSDLKLRENGRGSLVYLLSFPKFKEYGLASLYEPLVKASSERYFTYSVGLLTAPALEDLSAVLARSIYYLAGNVELRTALLVSLSESIVISERIHSTLAGENVGMVKLYQTEHSDNITYANLLRGLERSDIIFLNLHGNPYGMAKTTTGPLLLSARNVQKVRRGSIVVTLSCLTCNLEDLPSLEYSVAVSFILRGAAAYVGARRLEFVGELGGSTGYPEVMVALLAAEYTVGDAVRFINNIHISRLGGPKPWEVAYVCLLGDPDIKFGGLHERFFTASVEGERIIIKVLRNTSVVVGDIPIPEYNIKKFEIKDSTVDGLFITSVEEGERVLHFALTRFPGYRRGMFSRGEEITIHIVARQEIWQIAPVAVLVAVSAIFLSYLLKRKAR